MNRKVGFIASHLSTLAIVASTYAPKAFAAEVIDTCRGVGTQFSPLCYLNAGNFGNVIGSAINLIFVVAVVGALFYLIWGGIKWLMSEGDKTSVEAARQHIISALVGLIIIFLSYFILNLVVGFFTGGKGINQLELPSIKTTSS